MELLGKTCPRCNEVFGGGNLMQRGIDNLIKVVNNINNNKEALE